MDKSNNLFNESELEVIYLKAVIDFLDSMLTSTLFKLIGTDPDSEISFHQSTHQKYFYIILIDFLSKSRKKVTGKDVTCIEFLKSVQESPNFNLENSILKLNESIDTFDSWINEEVPIKIYLSNINQECEIKLKRKKIIDISANMSKHNFTRLTVVTDDICKILKKVNIKVDFHDSLLLFDNFYERLHDDILLYHSSNIVEMLNKLRWGIHEYLLPEFHRSYKKDLSDPQKLKYNYSVPKEIKHKFAKDCYWEIMNSVRREPHIKKFESTKWLKLRY